VNLEDYKALSESEDLPECLRTEYRWRYEKEVRREELRKRMDEENRRTMAVHRWQQDVRRELRKLFAEQFEVFAWERREAKPLWIDEARSKLDQKLRKLRPQIYRARSEAAGGCELQREWLELHAEMIAAVV
jgi:hypothetical protein